MLAASRSGRVSSPPRPSPPSLPSSSPCQRPSRNSRPKGRAPGRRRSKLAGPKERKENIDGTCCSTSRRPDAGAAELPNHGAHAAAPAPAAPEPEYVGELERLAQLREQGILSDQEFEAKKKQILGI